MRQDSQHVATAYCRRLGATPSTKRLGPFTAAAPDPLPGPLPQTCRMATFICPRHGHRLHVSDHHTQRKQFITSEAVGGFRALIAGLAHIAPLEKDLARKEV